MAQGPQMAQLGQAPHAATPAAPGYTPAVLQPLQTTQQLSAQSLQQAYPAQPPSQMVLQPLLPQQAQPSTAAAPSVRYVGVVPQ